MIAEYLGEGGNVFPVVDFPRTIDEQGKLFDNKSECHYPDASPCPCQKCSFIRHVNWGVTNFFRFLIFNY